jgi:hypothetical protein
MADKNTIEQMLEHLVNGDQAKAEELFHEYVVEASREIYESMIESEMSDEEDKDEEVEEAASDEESEEDQVDENFDEFEDLTIEADDEEESDPTDDLLGDVETDGEEGEMGSEEGEEDLESKVMDLEDAVEELEAKFAELAGEEAGEEGDMDDMGGMDDMGDMGDDGEEKMKDSFDQELATMREYVEKVAGGHGAEKKGAGEKGADTKSPVAGKNDMGGTTANIAKGGEGGGSDKGLLSPKTKEDNAGNVNTPGAKNGNAFSTKEPGHGAEKKGSAESADNKQSLFRK